MEVIWGIIATVFVYLFGDPLIRLITGTDSQEIVRYAVMNMRTVLPFFPVLGILLVQRTAMQAMGQKIAPIVSSAIEVIMRAFGEIEVIMERSEPENADNEDMMQNVKMVAVSE